MNTTGENERGLVRRISGLGQTEMWPVIFLGHFYQRNQTIKGDGIIHDK